uniref:BHLH domain-containing protein n=1 Tax=Plectus sambesii TaxID=2011161 RepID=A0A914WJV7_9BILA
MSNNLTANRRRAYHPGAAASAKKAPQSNDDNSGIVGDSNYQEVVIQSTGEHVYHSQPTATTTSSGANTVYRIIQLPSDGISTVQLQPQQVTTEPVQIVLGSAASSMAMGPGQQQITYSPARQQQQQQQPISSGRHIQLQTVDTPTGQCYLLMNPQEFVSQRNDKGIPTTAATFIPLTRFDSLTGQSSSPIGGQASPPGGSIPNDPQYTVKRRVSHNEVEKRRRDKINQWINRLARLLPDGDIDETSRQMQSKGGILSKTVDFITQLKETNAELVGLTDNLTEKCRSLEEDGDVGQIRDELERVREENRQLRHMLESSGLARPDEPKRMKLSE